MEDTTLKTLMMQVKELSDQIAELKGKSGAVSGIAKNHKPGVANVGRKYVLMSKSLNSWGKVPQQQKDLADILVKNLEVNVEYTEAQVFNTIVDQCGEYPSLYNSKQDPTYLFKYYRGLANKDNHAGFIARDFIRVIG